MSAPECTACGVCCTSRSPRHARVTGEDWSRLGDDAEELTTWIGNRAFMRIEDGRCAALAVSESGGFACLVYERRPAVCRELLRGSPACEAEIVRKQDEVRHRLPLWTGAASHASCAPEHGVADAEATGRRYSRGGAP